MRKITNDEFIKKAKDIYGDKYDYSLTNYQNIKSKVKIIYNGWIFEQKAEDHLLGKLCELRWDTERFIFESKKIHGDKYDYSMVKFINMKTNVIIILDGIAYNQSPSKHLMGRSPEKWIKLKSNKEYIEEARKVWGYKYDYSLVDYKGAHEEILIKYKNIIYKQKAIQHLLGYNCERDTIKNQDDFLRKCYERHGNKYDYSLVEYKGVEKKIKILYKGIIYEQKAGAHLYSNGLVENVIKKRTINEFIEMSNYIHNNKYNYDKSIYVNNSTKLIITCPKHGDFKQVPNSHLKGFGCNSCSESKGEKIISKYLTQHNIDFIRQEKFDGCVGIKYKLPFDFYLPKYRTVIEFDGIQHHQPVEHFGGVDAYERLKINDKIKNDYCEDNFIELIRIRYDQIDRIYDILNESLRMKIKSM
jgi:very-short-patch-repair endonuclease